MTRLSDEQALQVRQILAQRVQNLEKPPVSQHLDPYLQGWNEAIQEAVHEIMGGDPIHVDVCRTRDGCLSGHSHGPGCRYSRPQTDENGFLPVQASEWGRRKHGGLHARIEDLELPPEPPDDDPWG